MAALPVDYVRVYSEEGQSGALIEPIVLLTVQRDSISPNMAQWPQLSILMLVFLCSCDGQGDVDARPSRGWY